MTSPLVVVGAPVSGVGGKAAAVVVRGVDGVTHVGRRTIRILPHYPRRGRQRRPGGPAAGGDTMTPDCVRRRVDHGSPTSPAVVAAAARGVRRPRRHSDGTFGGPDDDGDDDVDLIVTAVSSGLTTITTSNFAAAHGRRQRQHRDDDLSADGRIDDCRFLVETETETETETARIRRRVTADERSALLCVTACDSTHHHQQQQCRKYMPVPSSTAANERIVGRRPFCSVGATGNGAGSGGSYNVPQSATEFAATNAVVDRGFSTVDSSSGIGVGAGRLSAPSRGGLSAAAATARCNRGNLSVDGGRRGNGESAGGAVLPPLMSTVVSTTVDGSRSNRRPADYGTSLLVGYPTQPPPKYQAASDGTARTANGGRAALSTAGILVDDGLGREKAKKKTKQVPREGPAAVDDDAAATKRRERVKKCIGCCKSFIAFLFSTIGLTCLLVGYTIIGGFVFESIEAPQEVRGGRTHARTPAIYR